MPVVSLSITLKFRLNDFTNFNTTRRAWIRLITVCGYLANRNIEKETENQFTSSMRHNTLNNAGHGCTLIDPNWLPILFIHSHRCKSFPMHKTGFPVAIHACWETHSVQYTICRRRKFPHYYTPFIVIDLFCLLWWMFDALHFHSIETNYSWIENDRFGWTKHYEWTCFFFPHIMATDDRQFVLHFHSLH